MKTDIKNHINIIVIAVMILILLIMGWSIWHQITSISYTKAFIRLGVSNCQRITTLETHSYGYKDANMIPNECPKIEEFLENEKAE